MLTAPKVGSLKIPLLLYADMVLLSWTSIGLWRLVQASLTYFTQNKLQLNFEKYKFLVFGKTRWPWLWSFKGKVVKEFNYLGVLFHHRLLWSSHHQVRTHITNLSSLVNMQFFNTWCNAYIPPALQIFNIKVKPQILYSIPIWMSSFNMHVERIQAKFLYKTFALPHCVSYVVMCQEAGQHKLETTALLSFCKFWQRSALHQIRMSCSEAYYLTQSFPLA